MDSAYYHPQYLLDEEQLKKIGSELLGNTGRFFAGPFGSELPSSLYLEAGIPLFRVGNVGSFEINFADMAYLSPEVHHNLSTSEVKPGDLLIVKASVGEKICKVPDSIPKANITQHIIALRPNGKTDIDFLAAFLFCEFGKRQLVRRSLGSIIQYLGVNDTRSVLYPPFSKTAQTYIGDKVRQAERLRERAGILKKQVHETLDNLVPPFDEQVRSFTKVKMPQLSDRLDIQPYRTHFLEQVESIKKIKYSQLNKIASLFSGDAVPTPEFLSSGIPLVRIRNIGLDGLIEQDVFVSSEYASRKKAYLAKPGQIVVGMDGYFKAQFFIEADLPQFINQRVAIIEATGIRPELLCFWLNRKEGQNQLNQWAVKTTVEHTSLSYISKVLIPRLDDKMEGVLADKILTSRIYIWLSGQLTTSAKFLVEALIEGNLTETELKDAQEALTRGDRGPDRAILQRLTRKGFDVAGEPRLFADLDALYAALDEARPTDEPVEA
ncbi:MAG: restriction endonuclease subunit S [Blastocatellia bacterium]|nr:restriction endonuclease subunit S [Blastocatellia bacterium]